MVLLAEEVGVDERRGIQHDARRLDRALTGIDRLLAT
jgi:hypothetical protein